MIVDDMDQDLQAFFEDALSAFDENQPVWQSHDRGTHFLPLTCCTYEASLSVPNHHLTTSRAQVSRSLDHNHTHTLTAPTLTANVWTRESTCIFFFFFCETRRRRAVLTCLCAAAMCRVERASERAVRSATGRSFAIISRESPSLLFVVSRVVGVLSVSLVSFTRRPVACSRSSLRM